MHTAKLPTIGEAWTCAGCVRAPHNVDALEAFALGYTSSRRELHGAEPFTLCAACVRIERIGVYVENMAYWTGLGSKRADVAAMLERPL